jgi:hypothetical protein
MQPTAQDIGNQGEEAGIRSLQCFMLIDTLFPFAWLFQNQGESSGKPSFISSADNLPLQISEIT